jgi:hypothetical protein
VNLYGDIHPIKHILLSPETRIQSVQTANCSLEQRFRFDSGRVLNPKTIDILDNTIALEHGTRPGKGLAEEEATVYRRSFHNCQNDFTVSGRWMAVLSDALHIVDLGTIVLL